MARKQDAPKPLFPLKHDFLRAFENVCQQATMMLTAVDTVIKHDKNIGAGAKQVLQERSKALRDAMYAQETED